MAIDVLIEENAALPAGKRSGARAGERKSGGENHDAGSGKQFADAGVTGVGKEKVSRGIQGKTLGGTQHSGSGRTIIATETSDPVARDRGDHAGEMVDFSDVGAWRARRARTSAGSAQAVSGGYLVQAAAVNPDQPHRNVAGRDALAVHAGLWTIDLRINTDGRIWELNYHLLQPTGAMARCQLAQAASVSRPLHLL